MGKHSSDSFSAGSDSLAPGGGSFPPDAASSATPAGMSGSSGQFGDPSGASDLVAQARGRADGFLFGDDRAIGSPPNWEAQQSTQLYHGATANNDPSTADSLGQAWGNHGKELQQAASDLYNAISELGAAWVGQGAGAAQGTLVGIANASSQASEAAHSMGDRLARQAVAAAEVKKMPLPKEFDPAQATSAMLAGGPAAMVNDMKAASDAAKDVKAQQVQYFRAYTQAMSEVDSSTPSFGPHSLGMAPTGSAAQGAKAISAAGGAIGGAGAAAGATPAGQANLAGAGAGDQSGVAHPDSGNEQTTQSGYTPDTAPGAAAGTGATSGSGSAAPQTPAASAGGGIGQSLGTAAVGGGLGLAAGKSLKAGSRTGSSAKAAASETAASSNNQSAGNSASANMPQNQGVVSPNGTIGGGGGANAAPAPAGGMGGMGGMGGAGSAAGQQEEDHTHASFLIEPDPDDAFGANEATPPPVIGAWADEED